MLLAAALGVAAPVAWTVAAAAPASAATCGPAPAGKVAVIVVIDDGTIDQHCVVVPERSTGMRALVDTHLAVDVRSGGFVCSIAGVPRVGCALDDPTAPSWSYWHGTSGGWEFSTVGAGGYRLPERCAVEGWSFGPPDAKKPPRITVPSVTCERPPAAPRPNAPSTTPPGPAPAPGGGGGDGAAPTTTATPGNGDAPSGGDDAAAGGSASGDVDAATSSTTPEDSQDTGGGADDSGAEDSGADADAEVRGAELSHGGGTSDEETGRAPGEPSDGAGGGAPWLGAAVAVVLAGAVGGGAVLRSRRDRRVHDGNA